MRNSIRIIVRAAKQWSDNDDSQLGAALAYYTLFSLAPLLVIAIHIAGAVFGEEAAQGKVEEQLTEVVGADTAKAVQTLVDSAAKPKSRWAPIVSYSLLVVAALGMFMHIRYALRIIWKLDEPKSSLLLPLLLNYALALLMVVVVGALVFALLATSLIISVCNRWLNAHFPHVPWPLSDVIVSFLFTTLLFASVYYVLSGRTIRLGHLWYGAFAAAFLFTLGKTAISWYLATNSSLSAYGAASSLVVLLIWVYYSAQILFFGAELIQARRTRSEWMEMKPPISASGAPQASVEP